ncbi:hypothetical protein RYX36_027619, partial [Vicia faba]
VYSFSLSHSFNGDHNFSFIDGHKGNYIDVALLFAKELRKTLASLNVNDQKNGVTLKPDP